MRHRGLFQRRTTQKNWTELTYPDDLEPNLQLFNRLLAGEIEHFTLNKRYMKKDGSIVHATIHTRAFRKEDGTIDHIVTLVEDITERKQAEEALRRSEERLRLAQQVARVGTFELNIQTGLDTWTPELEALYGLSPGGFPKTESAWENLVYSDDRAAAIRRREQTLETGQPVEGEWRVVWPDGSVHWLAGRWQAFKDESGKPLRLIGVNIDITERKRAEEALREATSGTNWLSEEQVLAFGTGIFAPASCTTRPVGRCCSAMTRMTLATALRIGPDFFIRTNVIGFSSFRTTSLQARHPRLPSSTACVTKTVPIAGSWHTPLPCEMNKAKRADS